MDASAAAASAAVTAATSAARGVGLDLDYIVSVSYIFIIGTVIKTFGSADYFNLPPMLAVQFVMQIFMSPPGPSVPLLLASTLMYVASVQQLRRYSDAPVETILCIAMLLTSAWLLLIGSYMWALASVVVFTPCVACYMYNGQRLTDNVWLIVCLTVMTTPALVLIFVLSNRYKKEGAYEQLVASEPDLFAKKK